MKLETFQQFMDFQLLDTGDSYRLEQWGPVRLMRPDPQIIWKRSLPTSEWQKATAEFVGGGERGKWTKRSQVPASWPVYFRPDIKMLARLTPFKHTGIFAEQAAHWEWLTDLLKDQPPLKILNLFAYTGGATMILTRLGHQVTHVDSSKPAIAWAKENQTANRFGSESIRWILDDAAKFAQRELVRGQKYDGIIMDPPAFGHSPSGKTWKFNRDLPQLLMNCADLLSKDAKFLIVNGYATNSSALALLNILEDVMDERSGSIDYGELCLKEKAGRMISTGIFARWQS
jgi:23S rRNA (cytosine1962-C5)-methyltransferase